MMCFRLPSNGLVMEDEMILDGAIISASFDEALETVSDDQHLYLCQFFPVWIPLSLKKEA